MVTYRTAGAWGAGKGGDLTPAEVDANFHELATALADIAADLAPSEIANIALQGTQLTITLEDARVFGPFTVPRAAFRFREDWEALTAYFGNDVVRIAEDGADDGIYLVRRAHTSQAAFDPDYDDGDGPVYQLMFAGGSGSGGVGARPIVEELGTTWSPTADDLGAHVRFDQSVTVTLPTDADLALPVGFWIGLRCADASTLNLVAGTGGTINSPIGKDPAGGGIEEGIINAIKISATQWDVWGDLASF